ncbi:MAG: hypothetical protein VW447_10495 [Limnobacter sp.]
MAKCVVLHSTIPYAQVHDAALKSALVPLPDLFAIVGVACEAWEEAVDWLCIESDSFCNTTSHPQEKLPDVIAFAEQWCELKQWSKDVHVVEI